MSYYTKLPAAKLWAVALRRLERIPHPGNRAIVREYLAERRAAGNIDPSTLTSDADEFQRFGTWVADRGFRDLQKADLVEFFGSIGHKNIRTHYKTYIVLRGFYRWLYQVGPAEAPPQFKGFHLKRAPKRKLEPEELITPDELQAMLRHCRTAQERCLIAMLYEAGPRSEEPLSVNVGGVEQDQYGYLVRMPDVDGLKTGPRPMRIIRAKAYLQAWLNEHAMRLNPQAPLFYGQSHRAPYQRMGYQTLYELVRRLPAPLPAHLGHGGRQARLGRLGHDEGLWLVGRVGHAGHLRPPLAPRRRPPHLGVLRRQGPRRWRLRRPPWPRPGCSATNTSEKVFCASCNAPLTSHAEAVIQAQKAAQWKEFIAQQVRQEMAGRAGNPA